MVRIDKGRRSRAQPTLTTSASVSHRPNSDPYASEHFPYTSTALLRPSAEPSDTFVGIWFCCRSAKASGVAMSSANLHDAR